MIPAARAALHTAETARSHLHAGDADVDALDAAWDAVVAARLALRTAIIATLAPDLLPAWSVLQSSPDRQSSAVATAALCRIPPVRIARALAYGEVDRDELADALDAAGWYAPQSDSPVILVAEGTMQSLRDMTAAEMLDHNDPVIVHLDTGRIDRLAARNLPPDMALLRAAAERKGCLTAWEQLRDMQESPPEGDLYAWTGAHLRLLTLLRRNEVAND